MNNETIIDLIMQDEEYALLDGLLYKSDIFGDVYVRNQFGSWTPIGDSTYGYN